MVEILVATDLTGWFSLSPIRFISFIFQEKWDPRNVLGNVRYCIVTEELPGALRP